MKVYTCVVVYTNEDKLEKWIKVNGGTKRTSKFGTYVDVPLQEDDKEVLYEYRVIDYTKYCGRIRDVTCGMQLYTFELVDGVLKASDVMCLMSRCRLGVWEVVDGEYIGYYTNNGELVLNDL